MFEVAIIYNDSHHGGDRRKKSAQCIFDFYQPKHWGTLQQCFLDLATLLCLGVAGVGAGQVNGVWQRSKALLGSIPNVQRARVNELANPDSDQPLAPHWRAT